MSSSGPPPEGSAPHEGRAEEGPFAWGESLDLELVGRDDELVRVVALLDAARAQSSGSLVLTGEPGIGKSALLGAAEQLASGFRCLWVRGAESEQVMANAGLLQAISPLRGRLADVPESQAAALSRALGWGSGPGGAERFLVAAATMSLLAAEAEDNPVLVLVDDLQWVDHESAAALVFAARRLQDDRVCFLWAARDPAPIADLVRGTPGMPLSGLPRDAARALVAERVAPPVADQLVADTAGNPLALLEISSRLTDAQRLGTAPLPDRLPVGERLKADYQHLLSGLSAPAWRAVLLCAIDRSASATTVARALAAADIDIDAALDEAGERGVLVRQAGGLAFRHPLLRTAALGVATTAQQRRAHLALAEALSAGSSPLDAAWHRAEAATSADPDLAGDLVELAEKSRSRSGYATASSVLERAASLTGDAVRGADLTARAAEDAFVAGDVTRARALAQRVLADTVDPGIRGRALTTLGVLEVSTGSVPRAVELLASAVEVAEGPALTHALTELSLARFRLSDLPGIADCAARMALTSDRDDPVQRLQSDFVGAVATAVSDEPGEVHQMMTGVISQIADPPLRDDPRSLVFLALAAGFIGDVAPVFSLGEHLLAIARERGAIGVLVPSLSLAAAGRAWLGDNAGAFADAGEAAELGDQLGYAVDVANAVAMLAWQSAARGLHDDARRSLARARELTVRAGTTTHASYLALTEAFCALCRGDADAAIAALEPRLVTDGGLGASGEPLGIAPDLVEAYVAAGRRTDAADLVARFAAVTPPDAPPLSLALLARTQGLAAEDHDSAAVAFEAALAAHAGSTHPFETARTRLHYGARLRRAGQRVKARDQLSQAREAFAAMDLLAWVERSDDELAATGARPRRRGVTSTEPLTSRETRVALLAARGLPNKEIAAALFLSPKTVERHLSSVYRKRGYRSRTELAAAFARSDATSG